MIFVNFKIYKQTFGDEALKLAEVCREVGKITGVKIIPVVSPLDLRVIKEKLGIEVWLQHLDIFFEGKHTGFISPLAACAAGADGALLNHSEHEMPPGQIRQILMLLKKESWKKEWHKQFNNLTIQQFNNFKICVCFKTKNQIFGWLKRLKPAPDFTAYEPPELIGGEISVSQAKPDVIKRMVKLLPKQQIIVGAGIHTAEDVKKSLALGAKGVLVSSDIVCAKDPKKELTELAEAFRKVKS